MFKVESLGFKVVVQSLIPLNLYKPS